MSSPNVDPIPSTWNPAVLQAVCAGANFDFAILHYYPGSYTKVTAAQLFTLPQTDMPRLVSTLKTQIASNCPASANTVQFLVTETGPNGTLATGTPSQIPGLYAAHEYLVSLETGIINVDWLELHNDYLTTTTEAPNPPFYGIQLAHLLAGVGDTLVSANQQHDSCARGSQSQRTEGSSANQRRSSKSKHSASCHQWSLYGNDSVRIHLRYRDQSINHRLAGHSNHHCWKHRDSYCTGLHRRRTPPQLNRQLFAKIVSGEKPHPISSNKSIIYKIKHQKMPKIRMSSLKTR